MSLCVKLQRASGVVLLCNHSDSNQCMRRSARQHDARTRMIVSIEWHAKHPRASTSCTRARNTSRSPAVGMSRCCRPLPVDPPTTSMNAPSTVMAAQWLRVGLFSGVALVQLSLAGLYTCFRIQSCHDRGANVTATGQRTPSNKRIATEALQLLRVPRRTHLYDADVCAGRVAAPEGVHGASVHRGTEKGPARQRERVEGTLQGKHGATTPPHATKARAGHGRRVSAARTAALAWLPWSSRCWWPRQTPPQPQMPARATRRPQWRTGRRPQRRPRARTCTGHGVHCVRAGQGGREHGRAASPLGRATHRGVGNSGRPDCHVLVCTSYASLGAYHRREHSHRTAPHSDRRQCCMCRPSTRHAYTRLTQSSSPWRQSHRPRTPCHP